MLAEIYLRKGVVYLPTMAKTAAGYYSGVEPVAVAPVTNPDAVKDAIGETIARGNPTIPTPGRDKWPRTCDFEVREGQIWSEFEREACNWAILQNGDTYQIKPGRKHIEGGSEDDPDKIQMLPKGATIGDVASQMVELVQAAYKKT